MIKIRDIYNRMNELCPSSLSLDWDNDGIMCMPDPDMSVGRILLTLDITNGAVEFACQNGVELIISHHPLVFKPIKRLSASDLTGGKLLALAGSNIAAMSFHTRLDAADGGVNDALAEKLSLVGVRPFGEDGEMIGRVGEVRECILSEFALFVKERLGIKYPISVVDAGRPVRRVAVLGGAGKDFIASAIEVGADTFVTGEVGYNALVDAKDMGLNIIIGGHYHTERPILDKIRDTLAATDRTLDFLFYDCDPEQFY